MNTLLHLSDPHFGRERASVVTALLNLHRQLQPELVIVSGDLTQRAWPYQFDRAAAFLRALEPQAQLIVPGNHDLPVFNLYARLLEPYQLYQRAFGVEREPVFETEQLLVIGVDTSTPRRRVDGEVTPAQVAQVSSRLRGAKPGQLRLVVVHQPVAVPAGSERQRLLHGAAEAVHDWVQAGADGVLGGHIHLPYVQALGHTYTALERHAWVIHAGTAVSDRLRMDAPNSVNELRYENASEPRLTVVRWDYDEAAHAFEVAGSHELHLDRRLRPGSAAA